RDKAKHAGKNTPTILVTSTDKRELIRRRVNLDKPAQVVILADSHCHFCAYCMQAVQTRPKMLRILERHSIWATPPGTELEFDTLQQWNKQHPKIPLNILYNLQGWPVIKHLAVPTFYFLQHGKVVAKHVGWPRNGNFPA